MAVVVFMSSSLNANSNVTSQIDDISDDCFEMAMGIYEAALFTYGGDRKKALSLGSWAYDDCIENGGY